VSHDALYVMCVCVCVCVRARAHAHISKELAALEHAVVMGPADARMMLCKNLCARSVLFRGGI